MNPVLPAWRRAGVLLPAVAALSVGSVLAALGTQHLLGMQPCAWCVLQRLIALGVATTALLAWGAHAARLTALRMVAAVAAALLGLCGVAAALWQHFVASSSTSCAMSFADRVMGFTGLDGRFPEVFAAYASCADAKAWLLGVPYEFWSLALFVACVLAAALAVRPPRR